MASTEAMEPALVRTPEQRLVALLRDIEALHAELEDLEHRIGELDGRLVDDDLDSRRTARAEELARHVAEELLRRSRAEIGASLAKAEQDATALMTQGRAPAGDVIDLRTKGEGDAVVPLDAAFGAFWSEPEAAAPGDWRRWAHPAEILLHLVILLGLIAIAVGAFR